ncbi:type II toxin-antitoxin system Phd/YefM family antitoxin [Streptomyces gelaticus]|uniref:type II toxin-antitoxin system Phd/YefM family antitoxin n=1 Tax=Streptomyces gelaticus TaxID=285446 RepID=UPI0037BB4CF3
MTHDARPRLAYGIGIGCRTSSAHASGSGGRLGPVVSPPPVHPCKAAVEATHQYNLHEARNHLSRILEQVATGEEVVIFRDGEPVAKIVSLRARVKRTGRGSLKGQIHIREDFDDLPDNLADAFGML